MCRFLVYVGDEILLADLLTRPKHSLITQSFRSKERPEPLNGDGFGIGWYREGDPVPCLFTAITPAWGNQNLHRLAEKLNSTCIFAHLRAASEGLIVSEINCHPFQYQELLWMHNGRIVGFERIKRSLREGLSDELYNFIQGTTDSEHAFALFLHYLLSGGPNYGLAEMKAAMLATIRHLDTLTEPFDQQDPSMYNFAVTDGRNVVTTRYSSDPVEKTPETLYFSKVGHFHCNEDEGKICLETGPTTAIIIASEPLTPDQRTWQAVPPNHIVTVDKELNLTLDAI
ncbi:MAG: class II glutamine amidotransferase [Chlamydiia bacterium]|nr:class II glutamine amidotransferase [Chlamydiia bacterium]